MGLQSFSYIPGQQYLYGRRWSIALGPSGIPNAVQYDSLRVRFDIEKIQLGTSNKAKIEIYNLSNESRQKIQKGWKVLLKVGYVNLVQTLFLGDILFNGVSAKRDGPDIVMSLECGDAEAQIANTTHDKSYPSGTTLVQVFQDLAAAMQTSIGTVYGVPSVVFNKGYVAHGQVAQTLNGLCKSYGLQWTVDNGVLNILSATAYDGATAEVVSSETGLIGVPSFDGQYTNFESLINPRIYPGKLVQLVSKNQSVNGYFRVQMAHYTGDTHDQKWSMSCKCITAPNVHQGGLTNQGYDFSRAVV